MLSKWTYYKVRIIIDLYVRMNWDSVIGDMQISFAEVFQWCKWEITVLWNLLLKYIETTIFQDPHKP